MNLRKQTFFAVSVTLISILLLLYALVSYIALTRFNRIEENLTIDHIKRVESAIQREATELGIKISDWSAWDDTYTFLQGNNDTYIEENIFPEALTTIQINTMIFYDLQHNVKAQLAINEHTGEEIPVEPELLEFFKNNPTIFERVYKEGEIKGPLVLNKGQYIIAINPIFPTKKDSASNGALVFIRTINESLTEKLNDVTNLSFSILPVHSFNKNTNNIHISTDNSTLKGNIIVPDIIGNNGLEIRIVVPRTIYQEGIQNLLIIGGIQLLAGLVILLFILVILNHNIISPLTSLIEAVKNVAEEKNFTTQIPIIQKNNEIGQLSTHINTMLTAIGELNTSLSDKNTVLGNQVEEIEKQNIQAQNTKRAILNLLEDARGLEVQLKRERDRAEGIITAMGEALIVTDNTGKILLMNPVAEQLINVNKEETIGKFWNNFITLYKNNVLVEQQNHPLYSVINNKTSIKATLDDDYYFKVANEKIFPVSFTLSPIVGENGELLGVVNVFDNITKEKNDKTIIEQTVSERTKELKEKNDALEKAQKEISEGWLQAQREKARLSSSLNSLPTGFILIDKDGSVFMANQATKTIVEMNETLTNIHILSEAMKPSCNIEELIQQSKDTKQINHKSDIVYKTKYLSVTVVPIILETTNEYIGTALMIEDITERKITDRARDEFFSIASHELRTPLTSIRGNTSMVLQYFPEILKENKELEEMLQDIHSSSVRLISIVNDFLNVSRLEMKKMTYKYSNFDIVELSRKVNKELEPNAHEKTDTLETECAQESLPQPFADPDRVKEVLLNLVGNAVKFTDKGVVKTVIAQQDGMIRVEISDSGLGIPKERQELLFRKFQQAGENIYTRDTSKSSGLGLYISKLMIEEMGGTIGLARSEEGKGSTFFFTLPLQEKK